MKAFFYMVHAALGLLITSALADEAAIQDKTPSQLQTLIREAHTKPRGAFLGTQLIAEAIKTQRIDFIPVLFSDPNLSLDFRTLVSELQPSIYSDKIAIVMLRSPMATFWPYEGPPRNGSLVIEMAGPEPLLIKPLTTAFERLLPNVTRETLKTMIWTKAGRNQLADQLYAAMQAKGGQFADTEKAILQGLSTTEMPEPASSAPASAHEPVAQPVAIVPPVIPKAPPAPQPQTAAIPPVKASAEQDVSLLWLGAGVAAALLVWFAKSRRA
jgi:hypothetical protein